MPPPMILSLSLSLLLLPMLLLLLLVQVLMLVQVLVLVQVQVLVLVLVQVLVPGWAGLGWAGPGRAGSVSQPPPGWPPPRFDRRRAIRAAKVCSITNRKNRPCAAENKACKMAPRFVRKAYPAAVSPFPSIVFFPLCRIEPQQRQGFMSRSVFEAVRLDDVVLQPSPIDPGWIIEGAPVARSGRWSCSPDSTTSMWVWDCTAGRFNWYFDCDETIHVIEGEVIVSSDGDAPRTLRAGDAALFYAGSRTEWHVPKYVRKHAILRPHIAGPALFVHKAFRKLASALR